MRPETKCWTTEEDSILGEAALAGCSVAEIASQVGRIGCWTKAILLRAVGIGAAA